MKYALLFSGGIDKDNNYSRYANDLGFIYEVLLGKQDYDVNNISVLFADGQAIKYNEMDINTKAASKINFNFTIDELKKTLKPEDQLLIVVSNHGCSVGTICMWGMDFITREDFVEKLNSLCCKKIFIFGQCYGGDFTELYIPNSIILSANLPNEVSYRSCEFLNDCQINFGEYDEFLYNLFSYVNGRYPDGNSLKQPKQGNSLYDAYCYAKEYDVFKDGITCKQHFLKEEPQIKECDLSSKEIEI